MRGWLQQQPDLNLAQLKEKLFQQKHLRVSVPSLWGSAICARQERVCFPTHSS
jgi:hypothetical protein